MTSVKDLRVADAPTREAPGRGRFAFTDDYSVFDWGKMPDQIPQKGAALCTMGAANFESLEAAGVPTHYRGVVDAGDADRVVDLHSAGTAPTEMAIDLVRVPDLPFVDGDYDYDAFHAEAGSNYVVPLEIVFRNTVPVGSSLRSRGTPEEYGLDVAEWPAEPVTLADPVVEFSTKFEEQDRYVDDAEADRIAGDAAVADLESLARRVNDLVTERAEAAGFEHQDGKIECAVIDGDLVVADVVGTFDENRFSYRGQQVSKEVVRQFYKSYDPTWVDAVSEAKAEADRRGVADWRELCGASPDHLPEDVIGTVSDLYRAGTNAYTDTEWFDAPDIDAAVDAVRDL